ncbi:hypothetical protein [Bradyrhizobium sp. LHD-71]|uniref:hypothetical protein n=1 Tax=Bradyrhizobium sp. LHD-71 TaxID=3072141 RepID=UPI00280CE49C|nr:hypothetical protein [Bradyrhizobium sp. LHD-71]MDQ8732551.1 hypothetical protein [Bradyrhizobium sp. LHD-71]
MRRRPISFTLACVTLIIGAVAGSAEAAELAVPLKAPAVVSPAGPWCGRCGELIVTRVRHRQLAMTYGPYFDPRERDEPRYYWGAVRSFPRYQTVYPVR